MPRPVIPAAVLAARGVPVRLITGQEVNVCYTFHSLMVLEGLHGGLQGAMQHLGNPEAAQFDAIVGLLAAGLEHEVVRTQEGQEPDPNDGSLLSDKEVLAWYLDSAEIGEYAAAMGEAFKRSFPQAEEAMAKAGEGDVDPSPASPGPTGSTSAPSTSAGPTPSSGEAPQP